MLKRLAVWLLAMVSAVSPASAGFFGDVSFKLNPADPSGKTKLLGQNFAFIDPKGVGWEAREGDPTDGASIPKIFWPLVGDNWTYEYLKAAVIHDHYCKRHVRPWRQTHRVFYDALVESGVPRSRAAVLYYAVFVGGPRWNEQIRGRPCSLVPGTTCVQDVQDAALVSVDREAMYDDPKVVADILGYQNLVAGAQSDVTADDVEEAAKVRNRDDVFLNHPPTEGITK